MGAVSVKCSRRSNPVLRDTLTEVDKTWTKAVAFNSPDSEYPVGWSRNGGNAENGLILTPDYPLSDGCPRIVWSAKSVTASSPDGGYISPYIDIDPTKLYRRFSYLKKIDNKDGRSYFGTYGFDANNSNIGLRIMSNGNNTTNPYFWTGDLPDEDKWYLLVGFIYPHTADNTSVKKGGIYELGNATKVANISTEFRWKDANAAKTRVRDYLYYTSKDDIEQRFFKPSIDVVDGTEMPLELLLGLDVT